jgi:murein DD-endopeptidase MepM/ murein hydrolase activator NlpD
VTAATAGPAPRRHIAAESDLDRALWRQPVDAPIVDFFRPPSNPYGPGNRGLEYRTTPGQAVTAVADGEVVFAGQVGGRMFVVVAHSASLRSTYAFLHRVVVARGDQVSQGQLVATAGTGLHLTARVNGRYVDPLPYFGMRWSVRLVPVEHRAVGPPSRVALGPH